jgi:hypothetical protein
MVLDGKWLPLQQNQVTKLKADKVHGYRNLIDQEKILFIA